MNTLSIIVPAYNESATIDIILDVLVNVDLPQGIEREIVIVNDCSTDKTHEECLNLIKEHHNELAYIKLSKNVGEHNAVMAGLKYSFGDWVIIMDDDFQNPPGEALKLLNYS